MVQSLIDCADAAQRMRPGEWFVAIVAVLLTVLVLAAFWLRVDGLATALLVLVMLVTLLILPLAWAMTPASDGPK